MPTTILINGARATVDNDGKWTLGKSLPPQMGKILQQITKHALAELSPADGEPSHEIASKAVKALGGKIIESTIVDDAPPDAVL